MRHIFTTLPIVFIAMLMSPVSTAGPSPYAKGRTVYRKRLSRCAMYWRRLGDIHKSSGTRLSRSTELYQELAKLTEKEFHRWLADPLNHHPRVNCKAGPFVNKREVMVLRHYVYNKTFNPPKKPIIVRQPLKRSKIRLVKTQRLLRQRLETLKRIRKWLPDYNKFRATPKKTRKLSPR